MASTWGDTHHHGSGDINQSAGRQEVYRSGTNGGRPAADRTRNVFVIHGRDEQVRQAVFGLLRKVDLQPLEWEPLVHATSIGTPFLGQVVDGAPEHAQAAVVLLTPDDVAMLHRDLHGTPEDPHEQHLAMQPRPNVLLELGIVLATHPTNTIILEFGRNLRPIADINGRNVIRFDPGTVHTPAPVQKLIGRLAKAGCPVNNHGTDWLDMTPFTNLAAYHRVP